MNITARRRRTTRTAGTGSTDRAGRPRRDVQLPTGRAIVGGLLVAVAALGIVAAHRAATTVERRAWLVVQRPVAAGSAIVADDLGLAPMSLHTVAQPRAFARPRDVIGRIALVPLTPGDLVQRGMIADRGADADTPGRRVGLRLDPSAALGGNVAVGDRVDIVAVPEPGGRSEVIVRGALVEQVDGGSGSEGGGLGGDGELALVVDVPDEDAARRVVDAHAGAGVTLIAGSTVRLDEPATGP